MPVRKSSLEGVAHIYENEGPVTHVMGNVMGNINTHTAYHKIVLPERELPPIRFRYKPPVDDLIGRKEEVEILRENLCIESPRIMFVSGLGGIGKTQFFKKFIEKNLRFYRNIIWINSQDRGSIEAEFKILAGGRLGITINDNGKEKDFGCILGMIFDKLSASKTLLVFDNVDELHTAAIVLDILGVHVKPHILITSRIEKFSESVDLIKLKVFSSEEALTYISKRLSSQMHNESDEEKIALAKILENLPLALLQATAHIRYRRAEDASYNICNYITDFNKYHEQIMSCDLFRQEDMLNQYEKTTLTTWNITMNAIKECQQHGELALRILHIIAYFDNVHIIREIFFNLKGLSSEQEMSKREVISAIRLNINYSMLDHYENQSVLSIHKLVQKLIKIQLEKERRSESILRDGLQLISQMKKIEKIRLCLEHGISIYLSALRFRELVIEFDDYPSMILKNLHLSGNYLRDFTFGFEINEQFTTILGCNHRSTLVLKFTIVFVK